MYNTTKRPILKNEERIVNPFAFIVQQATSENTIILFVCPPKFCIRIVSSFSWEFPCSQEKTKTMLMQNLGGQTKSIMVFSELAYLNAYTFEYFFRASRSPTQSPPPPSLEVPVRLCKAEQCYCYWRKKGLFGVFSRNIGIH